jgi:hypothetical protein
MPKAFWTLLARRRAMPLRSDQAAFAEALLNPDAEMPKDLRGRDGKPSAKRFSVYRNNVTVSLVEALMATFPAVVMIVGEEFFRAAASIYVRQDPPKSPVLISYGSGFPDFLETFEPAADLPYLADVARIEMAWVEAYHAFDQPVLRAEDLAAIPPESLGGISFDAHPSSRVIRSDHPIVTIWTMNRGGEVRPVDMNVPESALVTRSAMDVEVRRLPEGGGSFLVALCEGKSLGEAAEQAATDFPAFDLSANISGFLEAGVFSQIGTNR